MIVRLRVTPQHQIFVIALYVPPTSQTIDRKNVLQRFKEAVEFLKERYTDPSILVFSD